MKYKEGMTFKNVKVYVDKVAMSARTISSDIRYRQVLHEWFHGLRECKGYIGLSLTVCELC